MRSFNNFIKKQTVYPLAEAFYARSQRRWIHYLAFDLVCGNYIALDAAEVRAIPSCDSSAMVSPYTNKYSATLQAGISGQVLRPIGRFANGFVSDTSRPNLVLQRFRSSS